MGQRLVSLIASGTEIVSALGFKSQLVERSKTRLAEIAARSAPDGSPVQIACIEWIEPLLAAGNWIPELVKIAGGHDVFGPVGAHAPWLAWDDLLRADPDVIIVMPCGFGLERTRAEMPAMTSLPGWSSLRAVRDEKVFLTDGNHFFNRPGPRLVESAELLAEILQGPEVDYGHRGRAWQPL